MPEITGQVIILTASNADRSAAWYCSVLGWEQGDRYVQPDGHVQQVSLADPRSGLQLCLVYHKAGAGVFDEFRAGLDHLEFWSPGAAISTRGLRGSTIWESLTPGSRSRRTPQTQ